MKDKFFDYDTFKENKSEIINYPINSNFWKRNKLINKYNFVFHKNRYYLLFLSNSGENDHRKGFSKLKKYSHI